MRAAGADPSGQTLHSETISKYCHSNYLHQTKWHSSTVKIASMKKCATQELYRRPRSLEVAPPPTRSKYVTAVRPRGLERSLWRRASVTNSRHAWISSCGWPRTPPRRTVCSTTVVSSCAARKVIAAAERGAVSSLRLCLA
ncbi:lactococcin 972 family bacteriocin [Streptomyces antimycoticus]|uniref:lactococcin 972 family bacteriocin n=1 Tax=Streptomyces antimycoticus TaxID=68175 RepID=UPI001D13773F